MHRRRIISIVFFCIYLAVVAYLCFAKPDKMPELPQLWFGLPADKVGHFLMFTPFPLLGLIAFEGDRMSVSSKIMLVGILVTLGIGTATGTEKIQALLEYRTAEQSDLLADSLGLCCGAAAASIYILTRKKK